MPEEGMSEYLQASRMRLSAYRPHHGLVQLQYAHVTCSTSEHLYTEQGKQTPSTPTQHSCVAARYIETIDNGKSTCADRLKCWHAICNTCPADDPCKLLQCRLTPLGARLLEQIPQPLNSLHTACTARLSPM